MVYELNPVHPSALVVFKKEKVEPHFKIRKFYIKICISSFPPKNQRSSNSRQQLVEAEESLPGLEKTYILQLA